MSTRTHDHVHEHPHERAAEPRLAPSGNGTVMLDIGDGVGALVVHAPETMLGVEIELARRGEGRPFVHTEVRERQLPDGVVYAGVYPQVADGEYTLLDLDGAPRCDLRVVSGTVTEVAW